MTDSGVGDALVNRAAEALTGNMSTTAYYQPTARVAAAVLNAVLVLPEGFPDWPQLTVERIDCPACRAEGGKWRKAGRYGSTLPAEFVSCTTCTASGLLWVVHPTEEETR